MKYIFIKPYFLKKKEREREKQNIFYLLSAEFDLKELKVNLYHACTYYLCCRD